MATYRNIAATETDPFAPLTSSLMKALDDNVTATAEGDTSAPRVQGIALGGIYIGAADASGTSFAEFTGLAGTGFVEINLAVSMATSAAIRVGFTNNNGSSWGSSQTLYTGPAFATVAYATLIVSLQTGVSALVGIYARDGIASAANFSNYATLTVPANCNGVRVGLSGSGPGTATRAMIKRLGGLE